VVRDKLIKSGAVPSPTTPEEFAKLLRSEIARWGKIIREKGIKEG
jgi:tripartite-type tricarboxylate transporter receptor subunit TctC